MRFAPSDGGVSYKFMSATVPSPSVSLAWEVHAISTFTSCTISLKSAVVRDGLLPIASVECLVRSCDQLKPDS